MHFGPESRFLDIQLFFSLPSISRRCWSRSTTWRNCGWITTLCSPYRGWERTLRALQLTCRPPLISLSNPSFLPVCPRRSAGQSIGKLRQLRYLDLAKNRIESLDADISGCEALEDLLLSSNMLQQLPDTIGTRTTTLESFTFFWDLFNSLFIYF